MFTFSIERWGAWAPGLDDKERWQEWAWSPYCPCDTADTGDLPSIRFLPVLQRRRLTPLARMVFGCAWPLVQEQAPMPMIFASRHGETTRSFQLLRNVVAREPLSPTAFGLSVHNAIAGQWSIIRKETQETIALAGDEDMLEHALQEACLLIGAGAPQVLVVLAEELPPSDYRPWIDDVPFSYVIALRLSAGDDWCLDFRPSTAAPSVQIWPNPLNLLRHLIKETRSWTHTGPRLQWHWQRKAD